MMKAWVRKNDDLPPECDLSRLKGGVRSKYYQKAAAGTKLVLIEPELANVFPDALPMFVRDLPAYDDALWGI